jgi:signal transduction histidine kinase
VWHLHRITQRRQLQAAQLALAHETGKASSRQQLRELVAINEATREEERKHIAREVHDELGQVLTALRMDISLLGMRFGAQDAGLQATVQGMKTLVDRAIQGVRNVATHLRPVALDIGLVPAIEWLCDEVTRTNGLRCTVDVQGSLEFDEMRTVVIFRIVQESLTNIARYAQASAAKVTLACRGPNLWLEVCDDGIGFDVHTTSHQKSFGLLGMRERAIALGGGLDIASVPGCGTVVTLNIPLHVETSRSHT